MASRIAAPAHANSAINRDAASGSGSNVALLGAELSRGARVYNAWMDANLEVRLSGVCSDVFGARARVARCKDITAGAEKHVYAFDVEQADGYAELALVPELEALLSSLNQHAH